MGATPRDELWRYAYLDRPEVGSGIRLDLKLHSMITLI